VRGREEKGRNEEKRRGGGGRGGGEAKGRKRRREKVLRILLPTPYPIKSPWSEIDTGSTQPQETQELKSYCGPEKRKGICRIFGKQY
jgi:hypothetical protein